MPKPAVYITLRIDPELYAQAKAQAEATGKSLNQWMQDAAKAHLAKQAPAEQG